jgi:hypothetical protein
MGGSTFYHVLQIRVIQIRAGFENDAEGENYPSVSYFQPSGVDSVKQSGRPLTCAGHSLRGERLLQKS